MIDQSKNSQKSKFRTEYPKDFQFDYKDPVTLSKFISEGSRIIPSRVTRLSLTQQRKLKDSIKKARVLALLPMGFEAYDRFEKVEQISARPFDMDLESEDIKFESSFQEEVKVPFEKSRDKVYKEEFDRPPMPNENDIEEGFETKMQSGGLESESSLSENVETDKTKLYNTRDHSNEGPEIRKATEVKESLEKTHQASSQKSEEMVLPVSKGKKTTT